MALESTPKSVASDGTLRIWFVPAGSNPKSVAILNGATAKSITYSLVPDGYSRTTTEERIKDERLTMKQILERPGTIGDEVELQYVFGDAADVAAAALAEGVEGFLVVRSAIANDLAPTVGQKVDILTIQCGKQRKNKPTRNGVWTKAQNIFLTDQTQDDVALVA